MRRIRNLGVDPPKTAPLTFDQQLAMQRQQQQFSTQQQQNTANQQFQMQQAATAANYSTGAAFQRFAQPSYQMETFQPGFMQPQAGGGGTSPLVIVLVVFGVMATSIFLLMFLLKSVRPY